MYLKRGWSWTIGSVRKHKLIFILLVILQLLALVAFSYTIINYQVKILENAQGITQAMQNANFNPDSIQAGEPFIKDIFSVYQNYNSLLEQIYQLLLWLFLLFIIFNGLAWLGVHCLFRKISMAGTVIKFLASSLALLLPLMLLFYYIFKKNITLLSSSGWMLLILAGLIYYLLLVSFAFINLKSWKEFLKQILKNGFKKIHLTLIVLLLNISLISGSIFLIYLASDQIFLSAITIVLLGIVLVIARIFWLACLQEEDQDEKKAAQANNNDQSIDKTSTTSTQKLPEP